MTTERIKARGMARKWNQGWDWQIDADTEFAKLRIFSMPMGKHWKTERGAENAMRRAAERLNLDLDGNE